MDLIQVCLCEDWMDLIQVCLCGVAALRLCGFGRKQVFWSGTSGRVWQTYFWYCSCEDLADLLQMYLCEDWPTYFNCCSSEG